MLVHKVNRIRTKTSIAHDLSIAGTTSIADPFSVNGSVILPTNTQIVVESNVSVNILVDLVLDPISALSISNSSTVYIGGTD